MTAQKPIPIAACRPGTTPDPPETLGVTGSKLWRDVLEEWTLDDAAGLAVLEQAAQAYDRAESLRRQIQITGEVVETGNGGMKANPLIMCEIAARSLVARLLGRLGVLDREDKRGPGRPPGKGNPW